MEQSAETEAPLGRSPFYLTQRLTRRDTTGREGFDHLFSCQYMGSAEFEWGALPKSLAIIRAAKRKLKIHQGEVTRRGITVPVFVVGHRARVELVPDALTEWLADDYPRGKEWTYFPELVDGTSKNWHAETHAWWSLTSDVMWSLTEPVADDLLRGIRG